MERGWNEIKRQKKDANNQPTKNQLYETNYMKPIVPLLLLLGLSANAQHKFTVYFDFDVAEANTTSTQTLSKWIADNPLARIQKIYGYADKTGNEAYNQDLSERRALYVSEQLKASNLQLEYAEQKSFGESQSTAIRNPKDRKVDVFYAVPAIQPVPPPAHSIKVPTELQKQIINAQRGDKIRLKDMNFYNNQDEMLTTSRPVLEELLALLKDRMSIKIDIQGHVCCEPEKVDRLSLKRALKVYNFLVENGIDKSRITYKGFGISKPMYAIPEKNEEEKVANRRVEIEIIDK